MFSRFIFFLPVLLLMCSCASHKIEFKDVTNDVGLNKVGGQKAAWADLNDDGYPDIVSGGKVWKNVKGKKFVNVTKGSGIKPIHDGSVIADFNGDGCKDIYFIQNGGKLYLGNGDFTFRPGKADVNKAGAVQGMCAADLNNDGYVDLYLANYEIWKNQVGFRDIILRNDNGIMKKQWEACDEKLMRARGATSCDFNNDGRMDIYVSNYRLMPNFLWINDGNWKFRDEATIFRCAGTQRRNHVFKNCLKIPYGSSGHTIGSLWADFNNDTYFDLFVGNFSHPPKYQDRPQVLQNGGPQNSYRFFDRSKLAKIPWQESYGSPAAADIDNDGLVDIFFNTCYPRDNGRLLQNLGGWRFEDITEQTPIKSRRSYQNVFADFDNDGRIDLLNSGRLYRNVGNTYNFLEIKLLGEAPNTSAIGAKVIVQAGDKKYIRQVEAGTGTGNQNDLRLHFGLNDYSGNVKITVFWPNGKKQNTVSEINKFIEVKQL